MLIIIFQNAKMLGSRIVVAMQRICRTKVEAACEASSSTFPDMDLQCPSRHFPCRFRCSYHAGCTLFSLFPNPIRLSVFRAVLSLVLLCHFACVELD
jgi:hypothetical protein